MARLRKQKFAEEAYAVANNPTPAPAPPRIAAGYEILKSEKVWTPAETQILRDLLEKHRGFYYPKFAKHLPGFSYNQVHQELERLQVGTFCKTGRWTAGERKELLYLARKYPEDWFMVARKMSTPRTATQCRAAHRVIVLGHTKEPSRWSREETERLHHLVKLFREGKLDIEHKDTNSRNDVEYGFSSTDTDTSPRLRRMMQALKQDTAQSGSALADTPVKKASGIPWSKIASLMGFRTPVQCMSKWSNERCKQIHEREVFSGPWSLEEDRMLYTLFLQAPRKWTWLAQNLPRRRRLQSISWRHRCCIMHYVDMLKECRGPSWDPLADGFEEVHLRCEINTWYSGISEGYRIEDGYTCPYDLDLTGYRKWVADSPPQSPPTDEPSAPIKGLLPTVER
ncbi:hypothetical protein H4S08_002345 [Coemansia sp. RSA 1365]|nr:hypothetical protein H4S08_002345 [Coemansia sp. RSA 1365]